MGRIRTIKPDFFTHDGLYQLERKTKLPIRVAYAGLFTQCDREGRFKWKPLSLKAGVLPFDLVDFEQVLRVLEEEGFVVRYEVDGREYGYIPTFLDHQQINNREQASSLPEPPPINVLTRGARVPHASTTRHEGKGREGKGRERKGSLTTDSAVADPSVKKFREWVAEKAPEVGKMVEPFTDKQIQQLQDRYSPTTVAEVLSAMHNKKDLLKRYRSAYLTADNWCKRRKNQPNAAPTSLFNDSTQEDVNERIAKIHEQAARARSAAAPGYFDDGVREGPATE